MKVKKLSIIALVLVAFIGASALLHWRLSAEPQSAHLARAIPEPLR